MAPFNAFLDSLTPASVSLYLDAVFVFFFLAAGFLSLCILAACILVRFWLPEHRLPEGRKCYEMAIGTAFILWALITILELPIDIYLAYVSPETMGEDMLVVAYLGLVVLAVFWVLGVGAGLVYRGIGMLKVEVLRRRTERGTENTPEEDEEALPLHDVDKEEV